MRKLFVIILIFSIAAVGCSLFNGDEDEAATPTPLLSTPDTTPTVEVSPEATEEIAPAEAIRLNVWILPEFGAGVENPGSQVLYDQLGEFEAQHPELELNIEIKASAGQGGTLNYLRTGRGVAPEVLPDLILLETDQLSIAAVEELILPLDQHLDSEAVDDLYPAALSLARSGSDIVGYPLGLTNFQHTVFNSTVLSDTIPSSWEDLLQIDDALFVFPAAGQDGGQLALLFYLDAGGQLVGDTNQPALDVEPLTSALNQFTRARNAGTITPASLSLTSLPDVWNYYDNSISNVAQTESGVVLMELESDDRNSFAPVPGTDDAMPPLVKGWAWAVSTPDPVRQEGALQLMSWLISPDNMGEWSSQSMIIPSRRSALNAWDHEIDYVNYLQEQLPLAEPYPAGANSEVMSVLSEAVFSVMSQTKSPRTAAEEAIAALGQ